MSPLLLRALAGLLAAALIAWAGRRAGALSTSGALAATALGTLAAATGWRWAVVLVAYFVASSLLSHWRRGVKEARTRAVVAKGGARDAWQVLANGGVFGAAALAWLLAPNPLWAAAATGALAASTADTWGTEVGTVVGGSPRSLLGWRPVPPGTSGAVSAAGTLATIAGAAFIAALAGMLGWTGVLAAGLAGGVAGALADSLLGATIQQRRWCDACHAATERLVHGCGTRTRHTGGAAWMDNDVVNFACTMVGAVVSSLWTTTS